MIYLFSHTPFEGVENIKLIKIDFLSFKLKKRSYDGIIFTSKNSVIAMDQAGSFWKSLDAYCIGEESAKKVKELNGKVAYISKSGYGEDFAHALDKVAFGKTLLFPKAKKTVTDIKAITKNVHIEKIDVYETKCDENATIPPLAKDATLVFTSPSSIKCFLKKTTLKPTYKIVCIGKKTASFLPKGYECKMPQTRSIDACIQMATNL